VLTNAIVPSFSKDFSLRACSSKPKQRRHRPDLEAALEVHLPLPASVLENEKVRALIRSNLRLVLRDLMRTGGGHGGL
jgi:hypothetical protein